MAEEEVTEEEESGGGVNLGLEGHRASPEEEEERVTVDLDADEVRPEGPRGSNG